MKVFFQWTGYFFWGFVALGIVAMFFVDPEELNTNNSDDVSNVKSSEKVESKSKSKVTYDNYLKVKNDMSPDEVISILGDDYREDGRNTIANITTVSYTWNDGVFRSVNVTFQNDKVMSKTQIGLDN